MATRTLTVVFTDLADYTASVGRSDREAIRQLLAEHERRVTPVVTARGGRIVKNLGDSYMALFEAATDAAQACLEVVNTIVAEGGFAFRAAMATGDVEAIDGDAFGEAANLAARILAKTPTGEVWMSSTSRMCMNQTEVAWESVGRFALKGIAGEVPIYRLVPEGKTWLPQSLIHAARTRNLVRVRNGSMLPKMPPEPVILLEGYEPESDALRDIVDRLPVVDSADLFLQAYSIAPSDRYGWSDLGRGLLIGTLSAVDGAIEEVHRAMNQSIGTDTIILEINNSSVIDLVMSGLALPAVPMSDVVAGYTYDLLSDGRWTNQADSSTVRLEVSPAGVSVETREQGIIVGTQRMPVGSKRRLNDGDKIQAGGSTYVYTQVDDRGYLGFLVSDSAARVGVTEGHSVELGREPHHPGFALPDRRGQENIRWCVGERAARAREGGFTMDRALAGRCQAEVSVGAGKAQLVGLHKTCPTLRLRGRQLDKIVEAADLEIDDMIVLGTSVISVRRPRG